MYNIKQKFKTLIKELLSNKNLEIRNKFEIPKSLTNDEQFILKQIISNELSMSRPENVLNTIMASNYVCRNKIKGDFVECGIWRGGNSIAAKAIFNIYNEKKELYLYDTFAGMTEPSKFDFRLKDSKRAVDTFNKTKLMDKNNWCYASLDDVKENIKKYTGDLKNIKFIKGDILKTLKIKKYIPKKISILRLDTDWYDSTKLEMEILYPLLEKNGVLIIDDYNYWAGSKKAIDEYFHDNPLFKKPLLIPTDDGGGVCGIKI